MSLTLMATATDLFTALDPSERSASPLVQRLQRLWDEHRATRLQRAAAREQAAVSEVLDAVDAIRRGYGHDFESAHRYLDARGLDRAARSVH